MDRMTAGNQLRAGFDRSHLPRSIHGFAVVLTGRHVANLPGTIHFVAQAPGANRVRLRVAMVASQIAPFGAALHATFHQRG
jgi:hypothetical protein